MKWLLMLFFFLLIVPNSIAIGEDYISEFNNSGEQCSIYGQWKYLDEQLSERYIVDYRCCETNKCLDLPYDTRNNYLLDKSKLVDISKLIILKENIESGFIKEDNYNIENKSGSIICYFYGLDILKEESTNLAAKVTTEQIAPKLLSTKAASLVEEIYKVSKKFNFVKDVNPIALGISASCEGGKMIEYVALSSLNSCKLYIINEKNQYAYYGMIDDLINCDKESIEKLNEAKYSPNVLFKSAEKRILDSLKCFFSTSNQCQSYDETEYEYYLNKIKILQTNSLNVDNIQIKAEIAENRFKEKENQTKYELELFSIQINEIENKLKSGNGLTDLVYTAEYDFSNITNNFTMLKVDLQKAQDFAKLNRFNSAISTIKEDKDKIAMINIDLSKELNKNKKITTLGWIVIIIIVFFLGKKLFFDN